MGIWTDAARDRMSSRLTWRPCPEDGCTATRGEWCDQDAAPYADLVVIEGRTRMVHGARMLAVADAGLIPRRRLVTQFGDGPMPAGLAA